MFWKNESPQVGDDKSADFYLVVKIPDVPCYRLKVISWPSPGLCLMLRRFGVGEFPQRIPGHEESLLFPLQQLLYTDCR